MCVLTRHDQAARAVKLFELLKQRRFAGDGDGNWLSQQGMRQATERASRGGFAADALRLVEHNGVPRHVDQLPARNIIQRREPHDGSRNAVIQSDQK